MDATIGFCGFQRARRNGLWMCIPAMHDLENIFSIATSQDVFLSNPIAAPGLARGAYTNSESWYKISTGKSFLLRRGIMCDQCLDVLAVLRGEFLLPD
ncbi:MAG: hypothetical protein WCS31_14875 [Verrucomicrobiae bacterium]